MSSRLGWLVTVVWLAAASSASLTGCAEGAPAEPAVVIDGLKPDAGSTCGNNVVDTGELCDCPATASIMCAVPATITCDSMGMGTGLIYCDPQRCEFITEFCSKGTGGSGGSSGSAGRGG